MRRVDGRIRSITVWRLVLALALAQTLCVPGITSGVEPSRALSWTRGHCVNCETAREIVDVQFVGPREAWAIGYAPPEEIGAGDYAILHSRDAGRTWTELRRTYVHNETPSLSFASRDEGWIMFDDIVNADERLLQTRDGGLHWRRLPPMDLTLRGAQDVGGGVGYLYETDYNAKSSYVAETSDGGRNWRNFPMPAGLNIDRMIFSDRTHGLVAGCLNGQMTVLRTVNGGLRWDIVPLSLPRASARDPLCSVEVDDLSLRRDGRGVILVSKHVFANGDHSDFVEALRTGDGGASWSPILRNAPAIPVVSSSEPGVTGYVTISPAFTIARCIGAHSIIITKDDGLLMVSDDDGAHWTNFHLPHPVSGCRPFGAELTCAAGVSGEFWVLRISATERH
jgi:hypothetical protein